VGYVVLAVIVAELASIAIVSDALGWLWTMAGLGAAVVAGMTVLAGRGVATMGKAAEAMQSGKPIGPVVVDGALVALAGVLFIIPGFASDVVALALLVPPVRWLVRRRIASRFVMIQPEGMSNQPGFIDVEGHEVTTDVDDVNDDDEPRSRPLELP
jgi:UPF0716 protein FxsA